MKPALFVLLMFLPGCGMVNPIPYAALTRAVEVCESFDGLKTLTDHSYRTAERGDIEVVCRDGTRVSTRYHK
jgi:hypothetical protein